MQAPSSPSNVVCVSSHFKGEEFLRECKRQGAHVELVTRRRTEREPWPREALDAAVFLADEAGAELSSTSSASSRARASSTASSPSKSSTW